jgi:L-lysine 6-transaminase
MVRSTHCLRVIERERLVENAARVGALFLDGLQQLAADEPLLRGVRGRGLFLAFDLPDKARREAFYQGLFEHGLLAIRSGERSLRFRPVLDTTPEDAARALELLRAQCRRMRTRAG